MKDFNEHFLFYIINFVAGMLGISIDYLKNEKQKSTQKLVIKGLTALAIIFFIVPFVTEHVNYFKPVRMSSFLTLSLAYFNNQLWKYVFDMTIKKIDPNAKLEQEDNNDKNEEDGINN